MDREEKGLIGYQVEFWQKAVPGEIANVTRQEGFSPPLMMLTAAIKESVIRDAGEGTITKTMIRERVEEYRQDARFETMQDKIELAEQVLLKCFEQALGQPVTKRNIRPPSDFGLGR